MKTLTDQNITGVEFRCSNGKKGHKRKGDRTERRPMNPRKVARHLLETLKKEQMQGQPLCLNPEKLAKRLQVRLKDISRAISLLEKLQVVRPDQQPLGHDRPAHKRRAWEYNWMGSSYSVKHDKLKTATLK